MTTEEEEGLEPIAQRHVVDNKGHTVKVTLDINTGMVTEKCVDCEWWNCQ